MLIDYARSLTSRSRTARSDRHLGLVLAFVAGATNAGAFLAVGMYTSHMTGLISSMADDIALGRITLALGAFGAVLSFFCGAIVSSVMINFARRHDLESRFALPLLLEAALLLAFGVLGARLADWPGPFVPTTVALLCFMMGLQNAVITKVSGAVVRTTHMTGVITDLGIELGRLIYWNRSVRPAHLHVVADRDRLATLASLCACFLVGGITGALGFTHVGYLVTMPLALVLVLTAVVPVIDDIRDAARNRPRTPG